jgi:two-component system sensor histidine kinase KdpD
VGLLALTILLATLAAAALEGWAGVGDASAVYLVPVVVAAGVLGTWAAVGVSVLSFLVYDFLFTVPRFTFAVSDPSEWLSLLLFLILAVVIGRLTASLADRAEEADRRAREGVALVAMSRDVAMASTFEEAADAVSARLLADAEMDAVWVCATGAPQVVVASAGSVPGGPAGIPWTLMRATGGEASEWLRFQDDASADVPDDGLRDRYRVSVGPEDAPVGWIHATRAVGSPRPGRGARRLLVLAADQLDIAVRRDRLRDELTSAEVGRQSDALRAAILDSVSHDLRTPIASIRALAGGLADAADDPEPAMIRERAASIDREGSRLGGLVNGLLDMGRVQAGALAPDLRPYDLGELVETTLRNHPADGPAHPVAMAVPDDLAPVLADAVLFDVALGNVIDNAAVHSPAGTRISVTASAPEPGWLLVAVDDSGPGVPPDTLPHLFDRFYRVPAGREGARHGMGMGLAIARGFLEAMGGSISAEPSPLGGLGVRFRLPAAPEEGS